MPYGRRRRSVGRTFRRRSFRKYSGRGGRRFRRVIRPRRGFRKSVRFSNQRIRYTQAVVGDALWYNPVGFYEQSVSGTGPINGAIAANNPTVPNSAQSWTIPTGYRFYAGPRANSASSSTPGGGYASYVCYGCSVKMRVVNMGNTTLIASLYPSYPSATTITQMVAVVDQPNCRTCFVPPAGSSNMKMVKSAAVMSKLVGKGAGEITSDPAFSCGTNTVSPASPTNIGYMNYYVGDPDNTSSGTVCKLYFTVKWFVRFFNRIEGGGNW